MPAILTPTRALRHLAELSTDVRAAVVLGADGRLLAGDATIAATARELLQALAAAPAAAGGELLVSRCAGSALVVRAEAAGDAGAGAQALVVVAGPHALLPLLQHDLRTLLGDLTGVPAPESPSENADFAISPAISAAEALIAAATA